jgi:hypothetical protein
MGPDLLIHLADNKGGVNHAIQKIEDVHQSMTKIGISLHNQYVLGYYVRRTGGRGSTARSECS